MKNNTKCLLKILHDLDVSLYEYSIIKSVVIRLFEMKYKTVEAY